MTDTTTGAMPGPGATPDQAVQTTTTPATSGATPQAGTTAPADARSTATDDEAALGDAGKRIIAEARRQAREAEARARTSEQELTRLREASQSDTEKALAAARREGAAEVRQAFEVRIRRSEIRSALTAAGITATELDLASTAPEFGGLKVTDDGVEGLTEAVATFKALHPALFARPGAPVADLGGGPRGQSGALTIDQQIAAAQAAAAEAGAKGDRTAQRAAMDRHLDLSLQKLAKVGG